MTILRRNLPVKGTWVLLLIMNISLAEVSTAVPLVEDSVPSGGEVYDLRLKGDYDPSHLEPVWIRQSPMNEATVQVFQDGIIRIYHAPDRHSTKVLSIESTDGGITWSEPKLEFEANGIDQYPRRTLIDKNGQVHLLVFRGGNNLDVWHTKTANGQWSSLTKVTNGRIGAIRAFIQAKSGRLIYAYHRQLRDRKPPFGSSSTTAVFSDDNGKTWKESGDWVDAPCYPNFNGNNYGCVEPTIVQLEDRRLWILCRTQTGWQYQAFSDDEGETWSEGEASIFHSSNSPANLLHLPDGRLVLTWCNTTESDIRTFGQIYTHRDVLHMAISDDDGITWRGFREVFRIPTRNDQNNQPRGDHGTSYPNTAFTKEGKIILVTGQGEYGQGRAILLLDPQWLCQTEQKDDFSKGLEKWSCYTFVKLGLKTGRTLGPRLLDDPQAKGGTVLHIRKKYSQCFADGAVWNFPMARRGMVELRVKINPGSNGTVIALTDHHRHPNDPDGENTAMFVTQVGGESGLPLKPACWYTVKLKWDLETKTCIACVDGTKAATLRLKNDTKTGISYLRFRSLAAKEDVDSAGLLVDCVASRSDDPYSLPTRTE